MQGTGSEKLAQTTVSGSSDEEIVYRFPLGRVAVEPVPDLSGTFTVRLSWHRGKAIVPLFESTALRPVAQVTLHGHKFPVFLNQHSRKKRDRIVLAGKRKTARSARCALRFITVVEGREDRLTWTWRIGATPAAIANIPPPDTQTPPDQVTVFFPLAPGKARILTVPGISGAVAVWTNDLVVSVHTARAEGTKEGFLPTPTLTANKRGVELTLSQVDLSGHGVTLAWETWVAPARTASDAHAALLRHIADVADRHQIPVPAEPGLLTRIGSDAEAFLMDEKAVARRGADRLVYRAKNTAGADLHAVGEGVDAALLAAILLGRFYRSGDDALRRRARLLAQGICDFQIAIEESRHWGALWDVQTQKPKAKEYGDWRGAKTVSVAATARAARGLLIAHAHFGTEMMGRSAQTAAQWLLLRLDRDGFIEAARYNEEGPPLEGSTAPWVASEALTPFVETFRATRNEVFLKAAMRITQALQEGVADGTLSVETAPAEFLASAIEGLLAVSREYENGELVALAGRLGVGLRARRVADGSLVEPPDVPPVSPLAPTLAGARAALALARVDPDPVWPLLAFRAVRAAAHQAAANPGAISLADRGALCLLSAGVLLASAARAKGCVADYDRGSIARGWQTFLPDPATRDYIAVTAPDGTPLDHLALVCPASLQVLVVVIAPPAVAEAYLHKNNKRPFVKNLLNNDFDQRAVLSPLGDGSELHIGVFQADT